MNPDFFPAISARTWAWAVVFPLLVAMMGNLLAHRALAAFVCSSLSILALLGFAAVAVFPVMLRSSIDPAFSIGAFNGAAATEGLRTALCWWLAGLPFACGYFIWLFRVFRGRVEAGPETKPAQPHSLSQG